MALGAAVSAGSHNQTVLTEAASDSYTASFGLTPNPGTALPSGWTKSSSGVDITRTTYIGLYENGYIQSGDIFTGTLTSTSLTLTLKLSTFGGWSDPKTAKYTIDLINAGGTAVKTNAFSQVITATAADYSSVFSLTGAEAATVIGVKITDAIPATTGKFVRLTSIDIPYENDVAGRTLLGVAFTDDVPDKTLYFSGETFDYAGLTVTATYDLAPTTVVLLNSDCSWNLSTLAQGVNTVKATYSGMTTPSSVSVTAITPTQLQVSGVLGKTVYTSGEAFNPSGLTFTATYNDASTATITSCTFSPLAAGMTSVPASYKAGTTTVIVVVNGITVNAVPNLYISEYYEGTVGTNKAIEIYNGTGVSVNLSDYKIRVHANGGTSTTDLTLGTGILANNDVYVLVNATDLAITNVMDSSNASLSFNGDDAVSLFKVSSATNIDVIGTIGVDPGTRFVGSAANGDGTTLDSTLVRTKSTGYPNPVFTWSEWNSYPANTDFLGYHGGTKADAMEYGADFLKTTSSYCLSSTGTNIPWSNLSSAYGVLSNEAKDYFFSSSDGTITAAIERYSYLIQKYSSFAADNFIKNSSGTVRVSLGANPGDNQMVRSSTNLEIVLLIGLLGATALAGYFITSKRKEDQA